jgi:hypothetical protein
MNLYCTNLTNELTGRTERIRFNRVSFNRMMILVRSCQSSQCQKLIYEWLLPNDPKQQIIVIKAWQTCLSF